MTGRAFSVLLRPSRGDSSTAILPMIAFTIIGAATYLAAALARLLWVTPDNGFGQYKILAVALLTVLVVPAATLATSAARLSARRREDRLAVLRLLGASSVSVRGIAVIEATLVAASGAILGLLVYTASAPALVWVPVAGHVPLRDEVWLPMWTLGLLVFALTAVAAVSAALGMRRLIVSPLGVRMRTDAPRVRGARLLGGAVVLAAGASLLQLTSASWGPWGSRRRSWSS